MNQQQMLSRLSTAWKALLKDSVVLRHNFLPAPDHSDNPKSYSNDHQSDQLYQSGRACLTEAFEVMGYRNPPIVSRKPSGAPNWPKGFSGSITHASKQSLQPYTAVVVVKKRDIASIGIDAEYQPAITPRVWPLFLSGSEVNQLMRFTVDKRHQLAKAIWGIKESAIKASQCVGMENIAVEIASYNEVVNCNVSIRGKAESYQGKSILVNDWVLAVVVSD